MYRIENVLGFTDGRNYACAHYLLIVRMFLEIISSINSTMIFKYE